MTMNDAPQGPTLGRYVLERRIASGGMADVYLARQSGPYGFSKRVALKVLKREIAVDDDNVKAFIREALVAAEFRHPNLAQVYEVGDNNGQLFLAMELVQGLSVAAMMHMLAERGRELPRNVAVRIAIDTLDGLAHAHEAKDPNGKSLGLVHRDVSPQNIMVAVDGTVKVVDFGIARAEMAFGRTMAPRIKGKFSYMAPEQWDTAAKLDPRADLFAVGVVLYEMTTGGVRLFRGDGPRDLYKAVVMDPIPDPRTRDPGYPEPLAKIVMRALERGPMARWQSARAMRTALVEFAQAENWSLSSKAVADAVRSALGPGDIESRWEPVAGALVEPAVDPNSVVTADDPTRRPRVEEVPTRIDPARPARVAGSPSEPSRASVAPGSPVPGVSAALAAAISVAALGVGFFGGFLLGRTNASHATATAHPIRIALGASLNAARTTLASRWTSAHAAMPLQFDAASDPVLAVIARRADLAIVDHAPTAEENAASARANVSLESIPIGVLHSRFLVARAPVTDEARTFADWVRAPDVAPWVP